jgi:phenylpropionate dioxygenase-like ring-hydroxylating dioxygenase large terminal subunit
MQSIKELVEPDRVHRAVYTDAALFELELDRLFGRAWLILGHDSQVRNPGDFFTTRMGREPVIVTRHRDGSVRVLVNRCAHRGARVCEAACGTASEFVCAYHGWTYGTDGTLAGLPLPEGYARPAGESVGGGLMRVPRVDAYRGFLFASLAEHGPTLAEFLGPLRASFDDFVERAPQGEVEVAGGVFKHAYRGNWKLVLENHNDTVHPAFVHASSIWAARQQPPAASGAYSEIGVRQMLQNGAPWDVWENTGLWVAGYGHSWMADYHDDSRLVAALDHPAFAEYRAALERRLGRDGAARALGELRWNSIVYPNCSFMSQFRQLRIVHPIAVDRNSRLRVLVQAQGRARADVPRHDRVLERRQRHRLARAHRRPRGVRAHAGRVDRPALGLGVSRARARPRRGGRSRSAPRRKRHQRDPHP